MSKENFLSRTDLVLEPERLVGSNPIMSMPVKDMTPEQRAGTYAVLKYLTKLLDARVEEIKGPLLEDAKKGEPVIGVDGKPTGSLRLSFETVKAMAKRSGGKEPNEKKMAALLSSRKIEINKAYDETKTFTYNPSKVEQLIERGFLTAEEVDALKPSSHVLEVKGSEDFISWLEQRTRDPKTLASKKPEDEF